MEPGLDSLAAFANFKKPQNLQPPSACKSLQRVSRFALDLDLDYNFFFLICILQIINRAPSVRGHVESEPTTFASDEGRRLTLIAELARLMENTDI